MGLIPAEYDLRHERLQTLHMIARREKDRALALRTK
jgi:hypothetical protein